MRSCTASSLSSMTAFLQDGCNIAALKALIPPTVQVGPSTPKRQHVEPADGTKGWTSSSCVAVPTSKEIENAQIHTIIHCKYTNK